MIRKLIWLTLTFAWTANAEPVPVDPPVDNITSHTRVMHSVVLDEARPFTVHLPQGYARQPDRRYPVIFVLDGDGYAGLVAETVRLFHFRGQAPPVIVVGISNIDRTRDFTPFHVEDTPTSGGAGPFLRFLEEELLPFIDDEYRSNGYRVVFGHSFGGLLGVYALVCHPEIFNSCIAASPALYFDRGQTLRTIDEILAARPPEGPRYLFLSMADELTYAESLDFLKESLADEGSSWLRLHEVRYPDETHGSVALRVIPDGLRGLFEDWSPSRETRDAGWEAVQEHYRQVTTRIGFEVPVPEWLANDLGYAALERGELDEAIRLFTWNTERYPSSANAWDSLGEGMMKRGDTEKAVAYYRKSLALDPENGNAVRMLEELGAAP